MTSVQHLDAPVSDEQFAEQMAAERRIIEANYGPALTADCRWCDAFAGSPCRGFGIQPRPRPHAVRAEDGERQARRMEALRVKLAELDAAFDRRAAFTRVLEPGDPLGVDCDECGASRGVPCDPWERDERFHMSRGVRANQYARVAA